MARINSCLVRAVSVNKAKLITLFEVTGSVSAMVYALLIASNTGNGIRLGNHRSCPLGIAVA